jgi:hypothetical protein
MNKHSKVTDFRTKNSLTQSNSDNTATKRIVLAVTIDTVRTKSETLQTVICPVNL